MRTLALSLLLVLGTAFVSNAQKYGYIDSDYILDNMLEYQEAKEKLDKFAKRWQKEITDRYVVIKKKKDELARVEAVLPEEEREARIEEIEQLENETLELQQLRFGVNGDLFSKRKELIEPIQDKVFEALEKIASSGRYAFVFDKANQSNLIFADPKYDLSKRVLRELGISGK